MLHIVRLHTSAKLPHIRLVLPVNRDLENAVNGLFSRYLTYELSIVSLPYLLLLEFVKAELKSTLKRRQIHRTFRRTISLHSINYFKFRIFMSFRKNISLASKWHDVTVTLEGLLAGYTILILILCSVAARTKFKEIICSNTTFSFYFEVVKW